MWFGSENSVWRADAQAPQLDSCDGSVAGDFSVPKGGALTILVNTSDRAAECRSEAGSLPPSACFAQSPSRGPAGPIGTRTLDHLQGRTKTGMILLG